MAEKEASLPHEPASDDENAVTLLVRMPDGSRRGRRFLKSDNLQVSFSSKVMCLSIYLRSLSWFHYVVYCTLQAFFDFIDIGRVVKPGTYRLVIIHLNFQ